MQRGRVRIAVANVCLCAGTVCADTAKAVVCKAPFKSKFEYDYSARLSELTLEHGGRHMSKCSDKSIAVIVAYQEPNSVANLARNSTVKRISMLPVYLTNLHRYLQRSNLQYTLFLVEQMGGEEMARGLLFNSGFTVASSLAEFDCFVFHDVDTLPTRTVDYNCDEQKPRCLVPILRNARGQYQHMEMTDQFAHNVLFSTSKAQFVATNGFSNLYPAFSGEDDDFCHRAFHSNFSLRCERDEYFYDLLPKLYSVRSELLPTAASRQAFDGLNSRGSLASMQVQGLDAYTHVRVTVDEVKLKNDWLDSVNAAKQKRLQTHADHHSFHCI